jgi:AraC-like DNA-binding protein
MAAISNGLCAEATVDSAESSLGRWTSARWAPPPSDRLFGLVERIWYFDGQLGHAKERIFPDGRAELIVMLDDPHRDGDTPETAPFPAVCINGLRTRPSVVVPPPGRCRVLGIRLEPAGACALLADSIRDLIDVTIDVQAALGRHAGELGTRCAEVVQRSTDPARTALEAIRVGAAWTEARIRDDGIDPAVHFAERAIRSARGCVSVDAVAMELGLSRARFAERFRSRIGVTPKKFARIVRFGNALSMLAGAETIAAAAADLSYYDQAHLYRDFEEFARMTPGAFAAARRYEGSANLAE